MPTPGILDIENQFGDEALNNYENAQLTNTGLTLANNNNRKGNEAALGQLLVSGGKAGEGAFKQGQQMQAQNQADAARKQEVQGDVAGAGPDGTGSGSSGTAPTQSTPSSGGSLSSSQYSQLFGNFFRSMMNGGGNYGGGGGSAAPSGGGSGS